MKYLLFAILLVTIMIATGCINQKNDIATSIQTSITLSVNIITGSAPGSMGARTYCNDTRKILEVRGALPGTRFSDLIYSNDATQTDKDELLNLYKQMLSSFEKVRTSANELNILLLKDFPEVSNYQSCNWLVHCIDSESGTKCYEIPTKYRVTFTDNGIQKYQEFPISQPLNFDFNDNGLLKIIKI